MITIIPFSDSILKLKEEGITEISVPVSATKITFPIKQINHGLKKSKTKTTNKKNENKKSISCCQFKSWLYFVFVY